jgi:hypothetical protein
MAIAQYLIIWYGNLPEEVVWYTRRLSGGWEVVAVALAGLVLATRYLNGYWLAAPAFYPAATATWLDAVFGAGLGLIWLAAYRGALRRHWPAGPVTARASTSQAGAYRRA